MNKPIHINDEKATEKIEQGKELDWCMGCQ